MGNLNAFIAYLIKGLIFFNKKSPGSLPGTPFLVYYFICGSLLLRLLLRLLFHLIICR